MGDRLTARVGYSRAGVVQTSSSVYGRMSYLEMPSSFRSAQPPASCTQTRTLLLARLGRTGST